MANDYIQQFMTTLPEYQRQKITSMLDSKKESGQIKSEEEYREELDKLIEQLEESEPEPIMQVRPQAQKTNSDNFNKTFDEIGIDLHALFQQSNRLGDVLSKHQQLNESVIRTIKNSIKKMNDEVDRYLMLIGNNEGFVDSFYETFRDKTNIEKDMKFYSDPLTGRIINNNLVAKIDSTAEAIKLSTTQNYDRLTNESGSQLAQINILRQPGSGFIGKANKTYDISMAIDKDPETFWGEIILSDGEMEIDFSDFGISKGAFCEFEIVFNSLSVLTELTISPYTEFPMDIVNIRAYRDLQNEDNFVEIVKHTDNISIEEPHTIQFPAIETKKLIMVINQRHYKQNNYLIKKSERNNLEMWQKISDKEKDITLNNDWEQGIEDDINPTVDQNFLNSVSGWDIYQQKLKEFQKEMERNKKNAGLGGILVGALTAGAIVMTAGAITPAVAIGALGAGVGMGKATYNSALKDGKFNYDKLIKVTKNEYVYGTYDIDIRGKNYHPQSIYVSKPLTAPGNVNQIALDVTEEHPNLELIDDENFNANDKVTSIEYYITNVDNPNKDDWHSILPTGIDRIKSERLSVNVKNEATFRFKTSNRDSIIIRENNKVLNKNQYQILDDQTIKLDEYRHDNIYTAEYTPTEDSYIVNLADTENITNLLAKEKFKHGTNRNGMVQLKHFPFIDYKQVNEMEKTSGFDPNGNYKPLKVTLTGTIEGEQGNTHHTAKPANSMDEKAGPVTKNVTDYTTRIQPALRGYNPDKYQVFEYRQDGKKIFFSDTFNEHTGVDSTSSMASIEVEYAYLVSNIRLKAVLRRNINGYESITPILKDYTIKYKTVNMG